MKLIPNWKSVLTGSWSVRLTVLVRSDLALATGTALDYAGFYGTGTGDQPLGIANTNGVNVVDFAGAGSGGAAPCRLGAR